MTNQARENRPRRTQASGRLVSLLVLMALGSLPVTALAQEETETRRVRIRDGTNVSYSGVFGGDVRAEDLSRDCMGFVSNVPHFIVDNSQDRWVRLTVTAEGEADPILMLRGPNASVCNDDASEETRAPEIITYLSAGEYYVHVGGYARADSGSFQIRFLDFTAADFPELSAGDVLNLRGISGGDQDASSHGPGCVGGVSQRPNHIIRVPRPMFIQLDVASSSDLTLVVSSQTDVYCNDDARNTLDPRIVDWFDSGLVRVWVGSHNPDTETHYELQVRGSSAND